MSLEFNSLNPQVNDSRWNLLAKILIRLNAMSAVSGAVTDSISYAGPPVVNPPAIMSIVVDVNGRQWQFFNGQWN